MKNLNVSHAFLHAWSMAWKYKRILGGLYGILLILEIINFFLPLSLILSIGFGVLGIYASLVKTKLLLTIHDNKKIIWAQLIPSYATFINYFVLIIGLGFFVLCSLFLPLAFFAQKPLLKIIIGIFVVIMIIVVYVRYRFLLPLLIDTQCGITQALSMSAQLVQGNYVRLFFWFIIFDVGFFLRLIMSYCYLSELQQANFWRQFHLSPIFVSSYALTILTLIAFVLWFTIIPLLSLIFIHVYRTLRTAR